MSSPIGRYMAEGGPYLVLNRSIMEAMPLAWQISLLELMLDLHKVADGLTKLPDSYAVIAKNDRDQFIQDPYVSVLVPDPEIYQAVEKAFGRGYDDPSDVRAPTP
jgi:hypothetical protein